MRNHILLLLAAFIPSTLPNPAGENGLSEAELNILHAEAVLAGNAGEDNMWFNSIDAGLLDNLITEMNTMNKWFARIVKYWDDFTSGKDGSKIYLEGLSAKDEEGVAEDASAVQGEDSSNTTIAEGIPAAEGEAVPVETPVDAADAADAANATAPAAEGAANRADAGTADPAADGANTTAPAVDPAAGANSTDPAAGANSTDPAAGADAAAADPAAAPPADEAETTPAADAAAAPAADAAATTPAAAAAAPPAAPEAARGMIQREGLEEGDDPHNHEFIGGDDPHNHEFIGGDDPHNHE
ncbi:caM kinase-like vesicle-associated protein [Eurytemora carolleeae]|uniref:caM kinase-like vesicle-associated protein n=1 Tax=Eurytemora carolleeae TaxID=1294199 RepID=UPI000C76672C|nr:caM kinase-like vesicle-associated protein [Eurytemora carolleeae]|eukprot:XP_023325378.1 caM kinase-like vesicle-associated protein [Eurytemora affinis]